MSVPSPWVQRHAALIDAGATVLDYACGSGRHARWLAAAGWHVTAIDRDAAAICSLNGIANIEAICADLEEGKWPLENRTFQAVVVTRYLFRPRFANLLDCLAPNGVLIYETYMQGQEEFGRPSNPDFLLRPGELLERLTEDFSVVAFEQGRVNMPAPAVMQRLCAVKGRNVFSIPQQTVN